MVEYREKVFLWVFENIVNLHCFRAFFGAAPDPDSFLPQAPDSTSLGPVPNSFLPQAPDSAILCSVPDSFLPQAPASAILCLVPNSFLPQAPDYYIVQCAIKC